MSRKLKVALYALFTVAALGLSLLLTFPWDAVGRRLEYEAVRAVPGASIVIGEVGPALPVGLALGDITFQLPEMSGKPGPKLAIEKLRVKPSLFSLLSGEPGASFDVRALSGELSGHVKKTGPGEALELELVASTLQLDDGGVLKDFTGYELKGGVSGRAELTFDENGVVSDGTIDVIVAGAKFMGGRISGFTVPELNLGAPELNVTFDQGVGTIEKLALDSPDIQASIEEGKITMRKRLSLSLIKGKARAKPSAAWLEKAKLKAVVGFVPTSIRKPDGTFELALNGPLTRPARLPRMGF